jgi:hypothetical protein
MNSAPSDSAAQSTVEMMVSFFIDFLSSIFVLSSLTGRSSQRPLQIEDPWILGVGIPFNRDSAQE